MPTITLRDDRHFDVPAGRRLVLALEDAGVDILHRCGGNAKCTTCRVTFVRGEPTRMTMAELERLQARGLLGEFRLSCQITCEHDMTLTVINTVSNSDVEDAGPRPAGDITPVPVWTSVPPEQAVAD
jgi:ferredoxin